jgi:hypothetical protein
VRDHTRVLETLASLAPPGAPIAAAGD